MATYIPGGSRSIGSGHWLWGGINGVATKMPGRGRRSGGNCGRSGGRRAEKGRAKGLGGKNEGGEGGKLGRVEEIEEEWEGGVEIRGGTFEGPGIGEEIGKGTFEGPGIGEEEGEGVGVNLGGERLGEC
ncbi:12933_t:CDS:2 [Funneliformis geosporum]|uniref:12933_t:CDS:1 n=1 Tax=Funneliformis geosporum TaxID=1117311 RepID=A0A9W4SHP6_9GLOM|nr:12933_t:CDS:2 [Funneliformis geosporum]